MAVPEYVYHYTPTEGLQGIISDGKVWATDLQFMNDAQELTYARKSVLDELRAWAKPKNLTKEIEDLAKTIDATNPAPIAHHIYATCFCEDGDLLSQWRGYGQNSGYSIGFRTDLLQAANAESYLRKVVYGWENASQLMERLAQEMSNGFLRSGDPEEIKKFGRDVLLAIALIKHPSFKEEQEWRLMSTCTGLPSGLRFRTGAVGVVPFIDIPNIREAVTKVVVGPGQHPKERAEGVRYLLAKHGMGRVDVEWTSSPLRL